MTAGVGQVRDASIRRAGRVFRTYDRARPVEEPETSDLRKEQTVMNKHAFLLAGALAATLGFASPSFAADDAAKASMKQADAAHDSAKKQAKADYKANK